MSKKNSSAILKEGFKGNAELSKIYLNFKSKIKNIKKKTFLVAVSGGPDSLALAALAKSYTNEKKIKFYYVLVNHNLRDNSSSEANSVKKLLKKHKISLVILNNKKTIKNNLQKQAREVRYNLLKSFCKKKKISNILTAHNLEDQVETFFIRLSRGSGLHGLSSMRTSNKLSSSIKLIRPLLEIKKLQLIKISKLIFGKYYEDPTNVNTKYLRTRIRNFRKTLEKSGISYDQIFQSIKNLASSRDTIDLYLNKFFGDIVKKQKNKTLIDFKKYDYLNLEMKARVLNKTIKELNNSYYGLRTKKIYNLIDHLKLKKKGYSLGGCQIERDKDHIILKKS